MKRLHSQRGFTLVELLIVIGVIVVLISLLLPALSKARESANQIKCSASLRTLGQALSQHANDHRGCLPLSGVLWVGPSGSTLEDPNGLGDPTMRRYDWFDNGSNNWRPTALPAALSIYLTGTTAPQNGWGNVDTFIRTSPLQDFFVCPSDEATLEHTYTTQKWIYLQKADNYIDGWSSYTVNAEIFGWDDRGVLGITGHSRERGNLAGVAHPTETMMMCDGKATAGSAAAYEMWVHGAPQYLSDVYLGNTISAAGPIPFDLVRHRGTMNILYVDGHVDNQPILSTGSMTAVGALGSPGNSPSGGLQHVSIDVDFR